MRVIQHFLNNPLRNFNYIIGSEVTKEAVFIDPFDITQTLPLCQKGGFTPKYLLNTHAHHDHVKDNGNFLELDGTEKIILKDRERLKLSDREEIECRLTPGHMIEHYCFFLYEDGEMKSVIAGDTLFNAGVGNCKNGGDPELLFETIKNEFLDLGDDIILWPGHDYFLNNLSFAKTVDKNNDEIDKYIKKCNEQHDNNLFLQTTMGEEKKLNPFLRVFEKSFQENHNKDEKELFLWLRSKRDKW